MTFWAKLEGGEGFSCVATRGENIPAEGNSQCGDIVRRQFDMTGDRAGGSRGACGERGSDRSQGAGLRRGLQERFLLSVKWDFRRVWSKDVLRDVLWLESATGCSE